MSAAVLVAPALCLVLIAGSCSQPRLERIATALERSVPQQGTNRVTGSILVRLLDVKVKGAPSSALGNLGNIPQLPLAAARFAIQPAQQRTVLVGPNDEVVGVSTARVMYGRRRLNGPADTRPWVRLELDRLADIDVPRLEALEQQQDAGSLAVLSPQFAFDLLRGVLTGSVKQRILADGATSISFNTSIEKSNRELRRSEDQRDERKRLLRSLAVTGDIFKGVAQLRADGSLRLLRLMIKEAPNRQTAVTVQVDIDTDAGPRSAVTIDAPARDKTIRIGTLSALRTSLVENLAPGIRK